MLQSVDEQTAQARKEVNELILTLEDQLARGRINETFTASLNDEGYVVPSGRAPNAKHQTMLMMSVRRLIAMDKQDDGTLSITVDSAAIRAAAEKIRDSAANAQSEAARVKAFNEDAAQRDARAAEQRQLEQENAARLSLRRSIRSNF